MSEAVFRQGEPLFVDYTPSGADVSAGQVVIIGDSAFIAHGPIADGVKGALAAGNGVYKVVAGEAIAQCKKVYWDNSANKVVETATGNKLFGLVAPGNSASTDGDEIDVIHLPDLSGSTPAANVSFSAGSNLVGVDGSGSNAAPLTGTETRLDVLDTAVAAILTALKNAGLMATS